MDNNDMDISECIFLVKNIYEQKIIKEFKQISLRYTISRDVAIISIIGTGSGNSSEIMKKIFSVLSQLKINTNLVSTSEVKISILIKRDKSSELIKKLGDKFDLLEN
ncbi:aspartate kinase [Candidatus Methanophagaceae archaeon]|nr:aspartate kinase [Methanophagales archaeon]